MMPALLGRLQRYAKSPDLGPQLIRTIASSAGVHLLGMLLAFLVGIQLARGLGVDGYGAYGIAMALVAIAGVVAELGVPKLVMREIAAASAGEDSAMIHGVFRWAQRGIVRVALVVAVATTLGTLILVDDQSPVRPALWWGAPLILVAALVNMRAAALQGLHHVVRGQLATLVVRPLLFSILLLALFSTWPAAGPDEVMILNLLTATAVLVLAHVWLRSRMPKPAASPVERGREWRAAAIPMALADGLRIGQAQAGILLLGLLAVAAEAGLFRIAVSIWVIVAAPIAIANGVLSPISAKLHAQGDLRRLQLLSTRSARFMFVSVTALSLPFLIWGGPIISMLFGAEFAPAEPLLIILCVGQIVDAGLGRGSMLLLMTGHERRVSRAMFVGLGLNIILLAALVPTWGAHSAAVATALGVIAQSLLTWSDAKRLIGVDSSILSVRAKDVAGTARP